MSQGLLGAIAVTADILPLVLELQKTSRTSHSIDQHSLLPVYFGIMILSHRHDSGV